MEHVRRPVLTMPWVYCKERNAGVQMSPHLRTPERTPQTARLDVLAILPIAVEVLLRACLPTSVFLAIQSPVRPVTLPLPLLLPR